MTDKQFCSVLYKNSTEVYDYSASHRHSNSLAQLPQPFSRTLDGFPGTAAQLRCLRDCLGLDRAEETEMKQTCNVAFNHTVPDLSHKSAI